jgi:SAM-dependent methyltransferase
MLRVVRGQWSLGLSGGSYRALASIIQKPLSALLPRMSQGGIALTGNGEALPFADNSFDFVTNLGSLEHFVDPGLGLREMKRVLRSGGLIGLLVPNSYYLLDIVWHVWRRGYPVSHSQTIERFATAGQWSDLLKENGLQICETHKYNLCFPKTIYDLRWYLRSPLKLAFPLAAPMTPFNLSYSFFFICSKSAA